MLKSDMKQEINELHKLIGSKVQEIRISKGLTQLELAVAIGHSSTTIISQAELGSKKHFNIEQLYMISKVLECSLGDFLIFS